MMKVFRNECKSHESNFSSKRKILFLLLQTKKEKMKSKTISIREMQREQNNKTLKTNKLFEKQTKTEIS